MTRKFDEVAHPTIHRARMPARGSRVSGARSTYIHIPGATLCHFPLTLLDPSSAETRRKVAGDTHLAFGNPGSEYGEKYEDERAPTIIDRLRTVRGCSLAPATSPSPQHPSSSNRQNTQEDRAYYHDSHHCATPFSSLPSARSS